MIEGVIILKQYFKIFQQELFQLILDLKVTSVNSAAIKLLSLSNDLKLGSSYKRETFDDALVRVFFEPVLEHLEQSIEFSGEVDLSEIGKQLILLADGVKIYDEWRDFLGYVIVFDDASEQVKVQRIAGLAKLRRRIAHEIRIL